MAQFLGIKTGKYLIKESSEQIARQSMRQQRRQTSEDKTTSKRRGRRPKALHRSSDSIISSAIANQELNFYDASKHSLIELDSDVAGFMMYPHQITQYEHELVGESSTDQGCSNDFSAEDSRCEEGQVVHFKESNELRGDSETDRDVRHGSSDDGLLGLYVSQTPDSQGVDAGVVDADNSMEQNVIVSRLPSAGTGMPISSTDANSRDDDVGQSFLWEGDMSSPRTTCTYVEQETGCCCSPN